MRILRYIVSLPFAASSLVALVIYVAFRFLSSVMMILYFGGCRHVFYPLIVIKRRLRGEPAWQAVDLNLEQGIQPWSAATRALADADPDVVKIPCVCGHPRCENKDGMYAVRPSTSAPNEPVLWVAFDAEKALREASRIREEHEKVIAALGKRCFTLEEECANKVPRGLALDLDRRLTNALAERDAYREKIRIWEAASARYGWDLTRMINADVEGRINGSPRHDPDR